MTDAAAPSQAAGLEGLPRTAQGWIPITLFDKRYFHEGQDFLVQLSQLGGWPVEVKALVCAAQWSIDEEGCAPKFLGDWRYIDELRCLEPIAFRPMPEPAEWQELIALSALSDIQDFGKAA